MTRLSIRSASLIACLAIGPMPAVAHPHIFIDAGLELVLDAAGRVSEVQVTWRYDELYSLLLMQDYGLDADFDGALTEDEIAATLGFDLNWGEGFSGGLTLTRDGTPLVLGAPDPVSLSLTADGQLQTTHTRAVLSDDLDGAGAPVEATIYDEAFYIAFEMTLPMTVSGPQSCTPDLIRADLDAAYAMLEAEIERIGGAVADDDNFPEVGAIFADRVVFTCAAG